MLVIIYIALAFLVGLLGWNRRLGIFGHFLLALVLTPLVMLIYHICARGWDARQRHKLMEKALRARVVAEEASEKAAKAEQAALGGSCH